MLMLVALTATAQDKKSETLNEKYFDAKVSELVYRLDMTDEQKTKFIPVYRRYIEELRTVAIPRHKKAAERNKHEAKGDQKAGEHKKKEMTEEEKLERLHKRIESQMQIQSIRLKYMDEFSKVLTAKQVNKFYEVEDKIQKKLKERRQHPKGGKSLKARHRRQKKG